jgi:hypothetical protein
MNSLISHIRGDEIYRDGIITVSICRECESLNPKDILHNERVFPQRAAAAARNGYGVVVRNGE